MTRLNDRQFEIWLRRIREMRSEKHQPHNVEILLADLWWTLAEENEVDLKKGIIRIFNPFRIMRAKAREFRVIRATLAHKECCGLEVD